MYFNFDDEHPDVIIIERAMSWREAGLLALVFHLVITLLVVMAPQWFPVGPADRTEAEKQLALMRERQANNRRFVFIQPRAEFEAKHPPQAPELSDRDRSMQSPLAAPIPANPLPFSKGNTPERIDQPAIPAPQQPAQPQPTQDSASAERDAESPPPGPAGQPSLDAAALRGLTGPAARPAAGGGIGSGLGEALKNVQRYVPQQMFDNSQGGGQFGSAIQFDTKGVEFGPWVRRFIAQIKRNWFIPYAAMSLKGHVVVTFFVHKDGSITDLQVIGASSIDAFNNSSFNAIAASNPTQPLPPEYPSDKARFTVTFFYNETPPG